MKRLSDATLRDVRAGVRLPAYDRAAATTGVVHFGPGAFHRAHQACYFDDMLARHPGYAVAAVSPRSADLRDALAPQDGLFTVVEREAEPGFRVIGALRSVTTTQDPEAVFARLVTPDVRIVTATVTEKGYCLTTAGELDLENSDIRHDLTSPEQPRSFIGWLVEAVRRRRQVGLEPLTVISCDNLSDNGGKLQRAAIAYAVARGEPAVAARLEARVVFPSTMVDSITPATDEALRREVAEALGLADAGPVQRERFTQWVVEDRLGPHTEAFAAAGVTIAGDVAAYERAKLRLLNGAHSTLAYVGLGLGHETVAEAMSDAGLADFVERMLRQDVAPTLALDVDAYIGQVLARFRNPAIVHRLSQIAWDGSQKLRFRLLETIGDLLREGRSVARPAVGVAAWMRFVARQAKARAAITDPLAETLLQLGRAATGEAAADVAGFLALETVFPASLAARPQFRAAVEDAYGRLATDPRGLLTL